MNILNITRTKQINFKIYVYICIHFKTLDLEEMIKAESSISSRQRFELKMKSKQEQVNILKAQLNNFKNEKFKMKVAEFLCWINFIINPSGVFDQKLPSDIKACLSKLSRYENDIIIMAEDVNRRFKNISLTTTSPKP